MPRVEGWGEEWRSPDFFFARLGSSLGDDSGGLEDVEDQVQTEGRKTPVGNSFGHPVYWGVLQKTHL